jgi:hypothetical protein
VSYPAIRIIETTNELIDDASPECVIAAVDYPRHLRVLPDAIVHIKLSDDASDPPVVATVNDFIVNEFDEAVVLVAAGERVSIIGADSGNPTFVSVSEVRRDLA